AGSWDSSPLPKSALTLLLARLKLKKKTFTSTNYPDANQTGKVKNRRRFNCQVLNKAETETSHVRRNKPAFVVHSPGGAGTGHL
ncbi:hypothetical protein BaRGS_00040399, partial [Batillaria attramentaria]